MSELASAAAGPESAAAGPAEPIRVAGSRLVGDEDLPGWLRGLVGRLQGVKANDVVPFRMQFGPVRRRSSVLVLFGEGVSGPDLLLTARASTLRSHAGQPAFPGGAADPGENALATALREAQEETGLDPTSVTPVAMLPDLYLLPSQYLVSPVVGFWHRPGPVSAVDPAETAAVARVPLATLADPAHRGRVRHPNGFVGPAFAVADMVVWGFTAGIVDSLLELGGWARPWDRQRLLELDLPGPGRT